MNASATHPWNQLIATLRHTLAAGWRVVRWIWGVIWRVIALILLVFVLGNGQTVDTSLRGQVLAIVRDDLFDYVTWEVDALWDKTRQELFGVHAYLPDNERHDLTLTFLQQIAELQSVERQIEAIYADPSLDDPQASATSLIEARDTLRKAIEADQMLVESIIEEQVSSVLIDEGFGLLGQVLPPVSMHFTEIPMLLIVSPRDQIAFEVDLNLVSLTIEQREALEQAIEETLDVSALIVPLGGISLYPSMVLETPSLARAYEVTAHEWSHHYLMFFPLGLEYSMRAETRIINETVATWFGRAVAEAVIARYYPDQPAPQYASFFDETDSASTGHTPDHDPDGPAPFDYAAEMNETRVTVDFLLQQGKIGAAETYMEYRRREFVRHGYLIRKLNQAYFAFYSGYQGSRGAGGTDPIGPAVEKLRDSSPNLSAFLRTARGITTRDELLNTAAAVP